jgi:hypothetical protein
VADIVFIPCPSLNRVAIEIVGKVLRTDADASRREPDNLEPSGSDLFFQKTARATYPAGSFSKSKRNAFNYVLMCSVDHIPTQLRPKANGKNGGKLKLHPPYFLGSARLAFHPVLDSILSQNLSYARMIRLIFLGKPSHAPGAFRQRHLPQWVIAF